MVIIKVIKKQTVLKKYHAEVVMWSRDIYHRKPAIVQIGKKHIW